MRGGESQCVTIFVFKFNEKKTGYLLQIKNRTSLLYQRNICIFCSIQNCSSFGTANLLIPLLLACFLSFSYHIILCFFITLWSFISIWLSAWQRCIKNMKCDCHEKSHFSFYFLLSWLSSTHKRKRYTCTKHNTFKLLLIEQQKGNKKARTWFDDTGKIMYTFKLHAVYNLFA